MGGKLQVDENLVGALVGTIGTTDVDAGQTFTYTLLGDATKQFTIKGNKLYTVTALDFEQKASYTILVKTTDSGSPKLSFQKWLVVQVVDVNELPTLVKLTHSQVRG